MRRTALIVLMLAVASCGGEHSAVVKETLDAIRADERIRVRVRLERTELPTAEELLVRDQLEEQLTSQRIGTVVRRGADVGWYDVELEVESTADAVPRVRAVLQSMELAEKSSLEIRQGD